MNYISIESSLYFQKKIHQLYNVVLYLEYVNRVDIQVRLHTLTFVLFLVSLSTSTFRFSMRFVCIQIFHKEDVSPTRLNYSIIWCRVHQSQRKFLDIHLLSLLPVHGVHCDFSAFLTVSWSAFPRGLSGTFGDDSDISKLFVVSHKSLISKFIHDQNTFKRRVSKHPKTTSQDFLYKLSREWQLMGFLSFWSPRASLALM